MKKNKWLNSIVILAIILLLISIIGIVASVVYLIDGEVLAIYGLVVSSSIMLMGVVTFILACYWQTKLLVNEKF